VRTTTLLDMPLEEQVPMRATLRGARYGNVLALHNLLLCAMGRAPTEIPAWLFCSRSSVSRIVRAYRAGALGCPHDAQGHWGAPRRPTAVTARLRQTLVAVLQAAPEAYGWCRTRWSCATVALTLHAQAGVIVSAETVRRWRHALGWVWKGAKRIAKDNDPRSVARLAHIRWSFEHLQAGEVLVFADELDIHLLPKGGAMWMPKGT
jgi:transposase